MHLRKERDFSSGLFLWKGKKVYNLKKNILFDIIFTLCLSQLHILDDAVCISLCVDTLGKSMNPYDLFPAIGKWEDS